jgi:hypothetical protein
MKLLGAKTRSMASGVNWLRKMESSISKVAKLKRSVRPRIWAQTQQLARQSRTKSTLSTSLNVPRT